MLTSYARASTGNQSLILQIDALEEAGWGTGFSGPG